MAVTGATLERTPSPSLSKARCLTGEPPSAHCAAARHRLRRVGTGSAQRPLADRSQDESAVATLYCVAVFYAVFKCSPSWQHNARRPLGPHGTVVVRRISPSRPTTRCALWWRPTRSLKDEHRWHSRRLSRGGHLSHSTADSTPMRGLQAVLAARRSPTMLLPTSGERPAAGRAFVRRETSIRDPGPLWLIL